MVQPMISSFCPDLLTAGRQFRPMMPPGTRFSAHLTGVEVHKVTVEGVHHHQRVESLKIYGKISKGKFIHNGLSSV